MSAFSKKISLNKEISGKPQEDNLTPNSFKRKSLEKNIVEDSITNINKNINNVWTEKHIAKIISV